MHFYVLFTLKFVNSEDLMSEKSKIDTRKGSASESVDRGIIVIKSVKFTVNILR